MAPGAATACDRDWMLMAAFSRVVGVAGTRLRATLDSDFSELCSWLLAAVGVSNFSVAMSRVSMWCFHYLMHPPILGRIGKLPVRIDDEFVCDAGVEGFVAFRRLLKVDHLDI